MVCTSISPSKRPANTRTRCELTSRAPANHDDDASGDGKGCPIKGVGTYANYLLDKSKSHDKLDFKASAPWQRKAGGIGLTSDFSRSERGRGRDVKNGRPIDPSEEHGVGFRWPDDPMARSLRLSIMY